MDDKLNLFGRDDPDGERPGIFLETETRRVAEQFAPGRPVLMQDRHRDAIQAADATRAIEEALRKEPERPRLFISSLTARERSHGHFDNAASVAQRLKSAMRDTPSWEARLDAMQQEALENIATLLANVLAGDPNHREHWTNIVVFARLIEERLV